MGTRALSQYKDSLSGYGNFHYKDIKWSDDCLIFIMGILVLVSWHLLPPASYQFWNWNVSRSLTRSPFLFLILPLPHIAPCLSLPISHLYVTNIWLFQEQLQQLKMGTVQLAYAWLAFCVLILTNKISWPLYLFLSIYIYWNLLIICSILTSWFNTYNGTVTSTVWHIEAKTKWTPFGRRHFEVHFLEWKCLNSNWNFIEVCS